MQDKTRKSALLGGLEISYIWRNDFTISRSPILHSQNDMKGKEFIVKRKSAIKKDKASLKLKQLLEHALELKERQKLISHQMIQVTASIKRQTKIFKDNT